MKDKNKLQAILYLSSRTGSLVGRGGQSCLGRQGRGALQGSGLRALLGRWSPSKGEGDELFAREEGGGGGKELLWSVC